MVCVSDTPPGPVVFPIGIVCCGESHLARLYPIHVSGVVAVSIGTNGTNEQLMYVTFEAFVAFIMFAPPEMSDESASVSFVVALVALGKKH